MILGICGVVPENKKHLYNICTMLDQRRRRWDDVVQMLYRCFVFAGVGDAAKQPGLAEAVTDSHASQQTTCNHHSHSLALNVQRKQCPHAKQHA